MAGDVYEDNTNHDVYLAKTDATDNIIWANVLERAGFNDAIFKAKTTRDSGAIFCGTTNHATDGNNILLIRTDTLGEVLWSRQYGTTIDEMGTAVIQTNDDGYLLGGRKIDGSSSFPGILIKTDTSGLVQWVQKIDFGTTDTVHINDLLLGSNGDVIVSGSLLTDTSSFAFMVKLDFQGNLVWKRKYKAATRQSITANGLIRTGDEGFAYLVSSDEGVDQVGPYLIKTDVNGETLCDTAIAENILLTDTIVMDTIVFTTSPLSLSQDVTVVDTLGYGGFNPPTLVLETFGPYCPDEIFSDTLDATTPGAVAYEWSTDETTAAIVVTEFGDYMVTVTIGEDYCFILCGPTSINEKPLPEVEIGVDQGPYCTQGFVNLAANTNNATSLEWSTTEITSVIQVMNNGAYSVTATNECGSTVADLDLVINTTPPAIDITTEGDYCTEGQETLTANISGLFNSLLWSTGDNTETTIADDEGNYTVTISTDFCGDNAASYNLVAPPPPTVSIIPSGDYCVEGQEILTANISGLFNSLVWSTGDTTTTIVATLEDTYEVTVSADFCGDNSAIYNLNAENPVISIDSISEYCVEGESTLFIAGFSGPVSEYLWSTGETTDTILATVQGNYSVTITSVFCGEASAALEIICPLEIGVPNVFTPDGDDTNDTFHPFFDFPPSEFESYRFCVYSRWGEKVFETTDPTEAWDGRFKDEFAVSDVYVWTLEGKTRLGQEIEAEDRSGDVTLLR
jgi:gliding motility-associated-like protein